MKINGLLTMIHNRIHRHKIYGTSEYWDAKAGYFKDKSVSMWPNIYLNDLYDKEQKDMLSHYINRIPGKRVLDLGCGTGRLSEYFAQLGYEVVGIDFSAKSIDIAIKRNSNITYIIQSMLQLQERESFDAIVCWGSIAFACKNRSQLTDLFLRMHAALKPSGIILLCEPIHRGFLHRVLNLKIADFASTLNNNGFTLQCVEHLYFWPARLILANIQWSRTITDFGYVVGQWVLKNVLKNRAMGDYQLYYAKKK